jgi:serine/threonine protein kinase
MTPDRWQQIREVYFAVSDAEEQDRPALLAELTKGDPDLAAAVDLLLISPPDGQAALDHPPLGASPLPFPPTTSLVLGELLANRFEILSHLGSGGMGEVYEAEDRDLQTRIALKVIRPDVAETPGAIARFRREISLARQVTHRSICRVFDFFPSAKTSHGRTVDFLTMELLHGETLSKYITRQSPVPLSEAQPILNQLAAGLDAAHQARVLHRDLKGSNILLTTDAQGLRAVITDFGLARTHRTDDSPHSTSTVAAGTPLYMSPEQLEGGELTPASDLYSLGVLMYEMATGLPPYEGQSPLQVVVRRVKEERPPAPSSIYPQIDPGWEAAIMRCLAYNPNDRFNNATELAEAIGKPVPPAPVQKRSIAIPTRALQIAGILATLALAVYFWFQLSVPAPPQEALRWYNEGLQAINANSWSRASKLLERSIQQAPNFVAAHCRLAETYQQLDMRDRAQEQMLAALGNRTRNSDEEDLRIATQASLAAKWPEAISAAQRRLKSAEDPITAQLDLARWYSSAGQNKPAIEICTAILAKDPSHPGALLRLANVHANLNEPSKSRPLYQKARASFESLSSPEGLAEVDLALARIAPTVPEAITLATQAETLARQSKSNALIAQAMIVRAVRLESQGKLEEATKLYLDAIQVAESSGLYATVVNAWIDLAYLPYSKGNYESAANDFQKAISLAVRYHTLQAEARGKTALAGAYTNSNQAALALPLLEQSFNFYTQAGLRYLAVETIMFKGQALQKLNRFQEARNAYQSALKQSELPEDKIYLRDRLARLARIQSRYDLAAAEYAELIKLAAAQGQATREQNFRLDLAGSLGSLGRFSEAESEFDLILAQGFKAPRTEIQFEIEKAAVEFQKLSFDDSLKRLESLLARMKAEKKTAYELELLNQICPKYAEAGRHEKGLPICLNLLEIFKANPAQLTTAQYALAEIYMAKRQINLAVDYARQAVSNAQLVGIPINVWYSLLVLTQCLHQSGNPEWITTRERTRSVLADIRKDFGETNMKQYLSRPIIDRRYKAVENLN